MQGLIYFCTRLEEPATGSLVNYLKQMFGNDIRAFIPQISMSAGTIIACACKEIYMGKHSNLGPVDPQINGIPAYAVIEEIKRAYDEIVADSKKQYVWNPILGRYTPSFVQQCHWSVENAKEFVGTFLKENMFSSLSEAERDTKVSSIVDHLTNLSKNKGHDKHIHYDECREMGLLVHELEDKKDKKLQDLVLTVHHCYMYSLSNSPAFKIIENHTGRRYIKVLQQQVALQVPQFLQHAKEIKSLGPGGPT